MVAPEQEPKSSCWEPRVVRRPGARARPLPSFGFRVGKERHPDYSSPRGGGYSTFGLGLYAGSEGKGTVYCTASHRGFGEWSCKGSDPSGGFGAANLRETNWHDLEREMLQHGNMCPLRRELAKQQAQRRQVRNHHDLLVTFPWREPQGGFAG